MSLDDYSSYCSLAPGVGQRIKQLFTSDKRPSVDLKGEIKKLVFPTGGDPVIVSESAGTFTMVMATFHQYEKQVSAALAKESQCARVYSNMFVKGIGLSYE